MTGYSRLHFIIDMVKSNYIHHVDMYDYMVGRFYLLTPQERKSFLSKGRRSPLYGKFNDPKFIVYFQNKRVFLKWFKDFAHREWIGCDQATREEIIQFVRKHGKVMAKPLTGAQGKGIFVITPDPSDEEKLSSIIGQKYILEQFIQQDERMCFGSKSVNTLRIYSLIDSKGEAHVIKALMRVGVGDALVDNFHQGGVIYPVDLATGIVEEKGSMPDFGRNILVHPGTNITVLGFRVPRWEEVMEKVKLAALHRPEVRYVGWDVAISKTGVEFVEGNHLADMDLLHLLGHRVTYQDLLSAL